MARIYAKKWTNVPAKNLYLVMLTDIKNIPTLAIKPVSSLNFNDNLLFWMYVLYLHMIKH